MRRIRSMNTVPEKILSGILRSLRYKYRLHTKNLPGRPDFVFMKKRKALFLHGCFWHSHGRCSIARIPKSRQEYWVPKLKGNKKRDRRNIARLRNLGWKTLTVWECQLEDLERVKQRIKHFLRGT
jgi:DNA mismatch endonuclease (patch repair protein)